MARFVTEWAQHVVSADSGLVQLFEKPTKEYPAEGITRCFTIGNCPVAEGRFDRLLRALNLQASRALEIVNIEEEHLDEPCEPRVHQMIFTPLFDGETFLGRLALFAHVPDKKFGHADADLLSSVTAMLALHLANASLYQDQAETLTGLVRALSSVIEAKDPYTCGHSDRVAIMSRRLAKGVGLRLRRRSSDIYLGGVGYTDIGKIGIQDSILRKPGSLTPGEFEHIRTHALVGHSILEGLEAARHHPSRLFCIITRVGTETAILAASARTRHPAVGADRRRGGRVRCDEQRSTLTANVCLAKAFAESSARERGSNGTPR